MNTDKANYTRQNFQSSLLKQIIIRVDFSSITDLNSFILKVKANEWIKDSFQSYRTIQTNNFNINITHEVFADKIIPLSIAETSTIHRFYDCKIKPTENEVTLDITESFITVTVLCSDKYNSIDAYIECIGNVMEELYAYDQFTQLQRVAIRKIDGGDFNCENEVYSIFEKEKSAGMSSIEAHTKLLKKSYVDAYLDTEANLKVNLARSLEVISDNKYRYVLDIDGYIDSSSYDLSKCKSKDDIIDILQYKINEHLFTIFKGNVTLEFLNKGKKDNV